MVNNCSDINMIGDDIKNNSTRRLSMNIETVRKVYDYYANIYNFLFGKIFQPGRELTIELVNRNAIHAARILEVGVGTGLSLTNYRYDLNITGIDISEKMLIKAKKVILQKKLSDQIELKIMDVANLDFSDETFDFVVAMYVASVVPNIDQFLIEISRVCKSHGSILILNHFSSDNFLLNIMEKSINSIHSIVGFKSDFPIKTILNFPEFGLIDIYKTNLLGYWKLIHLKKINQ